MAERMLTPTDNQQTRSEQGIAMILVILLVIMRTILMGSLTFSLISTSQQSRLTRSYEEAYGIGLGAINKVIFEMEAAPWGGTTRRPPWWSWKTI